MVHLGRAASMGGLLRVAGLSDVFRAAGAEVHELALRTDVPATSTSALRSRPGALLSGCAVPESLAWSLPGALAALTQIEPDLVVCSTARSFHPAFAERWPVVVDFVDRLSDNYRDRAGVSSGLHAAGFRFLSATTARFEERSRDLPVDRLAAGWADADALDAEWVPITLGWPTPTAADRPAPDPVFDALFLGNLSYAPNVEAVERLGRIWPLVRRVRPDAHLLVAGARPGDAIRQLAADQGWELWADFDRLDDVLSAARIAVAPLVHASGIQTKVLEAAAHGLAQVVSPVAAGGLDPEFPVEVADSDEAFAAAILSLVADDAGRRALAIRASDHIEAAYRPERWVDWARSVLPR